MKQQSTPAVAVPMILPKIPIQNLLNGSGTLYTNVLANGTTSVTFMTTKVQDEVRVVIVTNTNTYNNNDTLYFHLTLGMPQNASALAVINHVDLLDTSNDSLELVGLRSEVRPSSVSISCYKVV